MYYFVTMILLWGEKRSFLKDTFSQLGFAKKDIFESHYVLKGWSYEV